jgi:hypothetical protein
MGIALDVVFFLCWVAVFVMIIRRGFIDRTFGVPFVAIFVNLAWDVVCAFIFRLPEPQVYTEVIFTFFDMIIAYQLLRNWQREFPHHSGAMLGALAAMTFVTALTLSAATTLQFNDTWNFYSGYAGNFLGSVLFNVMLAGRRDVRGQTIYIALLKGIGTGAASLGITVYPPPGYEGAILVTVLGLFTFVSDMIYVVLLYRQCVRQGLSPWRRF